MACGYSLRGHRGHPIRCPECGHENRTTVARLTEEINRRFATTMQSAAGCGIILYVATFLFERLSKGPPFVVIGFISMCGLWFAFFLVRFFTSIRNTVRRWLAFTTFVMLTECSACILCFGPSLSLGPYVWTAARPWAQSLCLCVGGIVLSIVLAIVALITGMNVLSSSVVSATGASASETSVEMDEAVEAAERPFLEHPET